MKMRQVNFILVLVITVYTLGCYAKNGSNKITRNIHNGYSGYGDIGGNRRALDRRWNKSAFEKKPGFRKGDGNGKYKKNMFGRDTSLDLGFDSDSNLRGGLGRGTRRAKQANRYHRIGRESAVRLDSELRMNESLHLDASNHSC
ncbi:uncharacterized protein LOC143254136 [Tachypleus tridentatus]|uniref:uncharacterized protein LOC143254136 n=1 Tax=Tachypleus tridentatus TaxID=6853 RepID=UPI003FD2FE93